MPFVVDLGIPVSAGMRKDLAHLRHAGESRHSGVISETQHLNPNEHRFTPGNPSNQREKGNADMVLDESPGKFTEFRRLLQTLRPEQRLAHLA